MSAGKFAGTQREAVAHLATSRPRVLGWWRSAALLDGDWGTSIAYVLGIGFALAGYSSFWHLMLMLGLTSLVAFNYITICRLYPTGGGVYSSVHHRSPNVAVIGALLLGADYVITISLSVFEAGHYFGIPSPTIWAITLIAAVGALNWFGPKHSSGLAIIISLLTIGTLAVIIIVSAPTALASAAVQPTSGGFFKNWGIFVGIILSISGIEAVSNMTGLMKHPGADSKKAIFAVLAKVIIATVFLALAMHAVPNISGHTEDMVRFLGEHYVGDWFGWIVALSLGVLLLSAGNTALNDLVSIQFLMSVDGELPAPLRRLNRHGVPIIPLVLSTAAPITVLIFVHDVITLAQLYAIGVVGAILINVGSTATDKSLNLPRSTRNLMLISAAILFLVEISIAFGKPKATLFAGIVLAIGLAARQVAKLRKAARAPQATPMLELGTHRTRVRHPAPGMRFLVAMKDRSDRLLRFAIEEAQARKALLIVLRVKEIAISALPERLELRLDAADEWIEDQCLNADIDYQIICIPSNEAGYTIAEQAAILGAERVILGTTRRSLLEKVLKGNVLRSVGSLLPEEVQLVIFGG